MTINATEQSQIGESRAALPFAVGIVGTGYISEFHARAIRDVEFVKLKAVCDANLRSAQAFATRWNVSAASSSLESMLDDQTLDCIHLLTPPDSHFLLARTALERGVHVFIEKPMCVDTSEAAELVEIARRKKLYLGVNHNFSFADAYQRLRAVVRSGELGPIDHIIFNHFYELPQIRFGPFGSWMLREPGNVILETGPHLFSALYDLIGEPEVPLASADRSVTLPNGKSIPRRWRVRTSVGRTAVDVNINFGPGFPQRTISIRGLFGTAMLDFDANTCVVDQCSPADMDIARYKRSRQTASQIRSQATQTLADYILGKLKFRKRGNPYDNSIRGSVSAFYNALRANDKLDSRIDGGRGQDVVEYCTTIINAADLVSAAAPIVPRAPVIDRPTVLVLGGSGFIGRELITHLIGSGYCVRAMVRGSSLALADIPGDRLEIVSGDIRNEDDLKRAMAGIEYVYHLARAEEKTWDDYVRNEVGPTRLVGQACLDANVKRLIYTGTIDSYYAGAKAGTITESTPLDPHIARRNYYARAKAASEALLTEMHRTRNLPLVIFRPGIVIGKRGNPFHWGVGRFSENICEVWGDGDNMLPFVLVSDVATALVRGIEVPAIEGRSYNLVDAPLISANDYLAELQQRAGIKLMIYHRPIWRFYLSDLGKWVVKLAVNHPDKVRIPSFSDWESRTQKAHYICDQTHTDLEWIPAGTREQLLLHGVGDALDSWLAAIR